jgi:hypothetical protein
MNKKIIPILLFTFFLSPNAYAEFLIYTVDNQFEAVFPGPPQLTGEIGKSPNRARGYNYPDEENSIVYTATYTLDKLPLTKKDVPEALNNYVEGSSLSVQGRILSRKKINIGGNDSVLFIIEYYLYDITVRKYGIVSYKNGFFYSWCVQGIPSVSTLNAHEIFNNYFEYFSIK